eukprot:scaffold7729_cov88-Skeletonema_dohrnii-CCMP3373.AAC.2
MRSLRRGTKNDAATNRRKGTSDTILLLLLVLMIGVIILNFIVGNQVAFNSAIHIEVTDKGVAIHPTLTNQPPVPLKLKKNIAMDIKSREDKVYSGQEITKFLTGELPFPKDCSDGSSSNKQCRLKFKPGTLQLSSVQTLQQCYVDAKKYKAHIKSMHEPVMTSVSHKHKIIYHYIPKSASSTARHAMFDHLEGKDYALPFDTKMNLVTTHNYTMISFIREPLTRFYSSYDEAFYRMGPWMGEGEVVRNQPNLRLHYQSVKHKIDKYPYLYEGMKEINDFRKMYCPKEVLDTGVFMACDDHDSIDDGRLLKRFEQFVHDYDGIEPFDVHLNMQTTNLIYETGEPLPMSALYNASNAEKEWQEVASQKGVTIPDGAMKHGRHQSRRFDVSKVSEVTQQKICQLLALDYCCLNFKLPEVCDDVGLYCALEQMEGKRMWKKDDSLNVVIRPWEQHP